MADYSINKGSYVSVYVGICQSQSRLVAEVNHLDYPSTKYEVRRGCMDGGDHAGCLEEVEVVKEAVSKGWKKGD